jgi:5-methylthioadenosine/S-adenosylhomocysteine deaminase
MRPEGDISTRSTGSVPTANGIVLYHFAIAATHRGNKLMLTLIRNATVLTIDAARNVYPDGAVAVENDRIVAVGSSAQLAERYKDADKVIDGKHQVVLPGFISGHNHLGYAVFRGRAEDIGRDATQRLYLPMSAAMTRDEREAIGCLAIAELLRGGVTTVLEMEEDADLFPAFIESVGMRAGIGIMVNDLDLEQLAQGNHVFDEAVRNQQLEQAVRLIEQWHGKANGRIQGYMALTGLSSSSPQLLKAVRETVDRFGVRLSAHLGFGEGEMVKKVHGMAQFDYATEHGVLGPDLVAVHCYKINDAEVEVIASSGAHLAHCPLMNQFRGEIAPIQNMRAQGMNVCLGIDNYFSDFFELLRACIAVARIRAQRPDVLSAPEVLELATINAARAMGMEDQVGSLEVGKKADLQMVDMHRYGLTPTNDPVCTLVYHAHAKDVHTVMIDGRIVVQDGKVIGVDEESMIETAGLASNSAWESFAAQHGGYIATAPEM